MIVASGANAGTYFYHQDGLGSVVALSKFDTNNGYASIVERYEYSAFGETTVCDGSGTPRTPNQSAYGNSCMFAGREYEPETSLYYYRARFYKPDIGRFLQVDPIGYDDGPNMYTYCGNNPLVFVDPMGLCKGGLSKWDQFKSTALEGLAEGIGKWYEASGGEQMEQKLWAGRHVGTQYGDKAADWYVRKYLQSTTWYGKIGYYTGGALSSLWTPEAWKKTTVTLTAAAIVAKPASKTGPWLGKIEHQPPHAGGPHQYPHIQIMIRVGKHVTKHFRIPWPW